MGIETCDDDFCEFITRTKATNLSGESCYNFAFCGDHFHDFITVQCYHHFKLDKKLWKKEVV